MSTLRHVQKIIGRKVDWGLRHAVLTSTFLAIGRGPTEHIVDYFPLHEVTSIKMVKELAQEENKGDAKMQTMALLVGKGKEDAAPQSFSDDDFAFFINTNPTGFNAGGQ